MRKVMQMTAIEFQCLQVVKECQYKTLDSFGDKAKFLGKEFYPTDNWFFIANYNGGVDPGFDILPISIV